MNKQPKISTIIVLFFAVALIFNFFIARASHLKDSVRYSNPQMWSLDRAPKFEDFPVAEISKTQFAEVDVNSSPSAQEFRTALRDAAKDGPNFAGHYTVAEWGCGSTCQDGMIIDIATGKVYDPFTEATSRGIDYTLNSNLFISDPPDDSTEGFISQLPVKYYVWKDNQLIQIYQEECYITNNTYTCK